MGLLFLPIPLALNFSERLLFSRKGGGGEDRDRGTASSMNIASYLALTFSLPLFITITRFSQAVWFLHCP